MEKRIIQRESHLDKKIELLEMKEAEITREGKGLDPAGKGDFGTGEEGGRPP